MWSLNVVATYVEAADTIVARAWVKDTTSNRFVIGAVDKAEFRLVDTATGQILQTLLVTPRLGNSDGSFNAVWLHPLRSKAVSVEFVTNILNQDPPIHLERIVPVKLDQQPNPTVLASQPSQDPAVLDIRARARVNELLTT